MSYKRSRSAENENNGLLLDNNFIIGEGTTSTVYSNKDNEGNDIAIKVLEFNEKTFEETSPYQWLKKHNCEHLIKIIDIKVISNSIHIEMQRYDGTLSDLILFQHCFPENILKLITYQMCFGLNYLHERQMLHGDLHAENVFYKDLIFNPFTKEIENIHIVIGDFGETENKNSFSIENDDMTNLGCILLQLITKDLKASPCNEEGFENYFIKNNCISNEFKNFVKNLILNNRRQIVPKEIVFAYKSDEWSDLCDDNFPIIENKIIPNELIYFSDYDSIKAYIYKRYLNIITTYELPCLVLQNNQLFKPNYEYQVTSLNTKKGYINIKPKRLIFNNTKIETELIPEPVKCKITISQHKQPKIDGLVAVDKSKMKPHAKSWEKSASLPVTIATNNKIDNDYCFVGFEKSNFHTTNGNLVCFKKTGRGVFDGFIKSVPKSEITLPQNTKIEQPWFKSKVCVYENPTISSVFDVVLNQQLQGVSPAATYLQVMTHCIDQGIPVFIVGGAVRDVIYAVLKDKETNVQNILNKVKDINIRFGCPAHEFCQTIAQNWPKEPSPPGPRGSVIIGNRACNSFLEGKAISGLNNDTYPVKSDIPKCFGTDLVRDNICIDFTCNALWYDPINKCIIDPTGDGQGIKDVLEKVIRIPVKEKYWSFWTKGNPSKIMRYYKFMQMGYRPADEKTRQFIIRTAKEFTRDDIFMECLGQLKIGVMNRKTDTHAQQKKKEFLNVIRNDLGDNFITTYFPNC